VAVCAFACGHARANSFVGKVIEINDGDEITIFNMNRPVRIRLIGMDAPERNQPFGDIARQHLSDLVYDKQVLVEYSGIGEHSSLIGRVLLNDLDISAQMIRDGAAWFDAINGDRLDATNRDIYQQSELAARSERRGLWQEANAVAPWEFVKAENLKKHPVVSLKANEPSTKVKSNGAASELTNFALMTRDVKAAEPTAFAAEVKSEMIEGTSLPAGLPVIAFPPPNGTRLVKSMTFGGALVKTNQYLATEGRNVYSVAWFTAPTHGEDDSTALDQFIFNEFMAGTAGAFTGGDSKARCDPQSEKDVSANGYFGVELDLSQCLFPTRIRAFTRVTGDQREVYFAAVTFRDEDANVTRFVKTFTIRSKKAPKK